jgi:hypothetical protein
VPRKPHLACPVKCEAYLTRAGKDESVEYPYYYFLFFDEGK